MTNKTEKKQLVLLQQGLDTLNLILSNKAQQQLVAFLSLLAKWNKTYNLTAIIEPSAMVTQHLLDSLAIQPYLSGKRIIDVGSGAGIPGIPLAIVNPERAFVLIDSNGKKTRFIQQALHNLNITNATVVNERTELYYPNDCFDSVISRAFSSLDNMIKITNHLRCKNGRFLAMKGGVDFNEFSAIGASFTIVEVRKLMVPGLDAERHLIIIEESHSG